MAPDTRVFTLTVPSDLNMLSVVRNFVESTGQACSLEKPTLHAAVMAAGEAITNIVRHAHRHLNSATMEIQLEIDPECVALTFHDQGEPFDLAAVPPMNPGEIRVGGRGVFLMRALMDEVTCRPRQSGQRGNTLRMSKRRQPVLRIRECG